MKINFKGLVDLHVLPTTEPLLPLYEAIVNSIQSIEETNRRDGKIEIEIQRDSQVSLFEDSWETDVENITITDNGIGFNEENFNSFETYASDFKFKKGCKGVGRIIWLKAFNDIYVESIYKKDNSFRKRTFKFNDTKAVYDNVDVVDNEASDIKTIIKLNGLKSKIRKITPKRLETIARNILNHCFVYFITQNMPQIIIRDEKDTIIVNHLFEEMKKENVVVEDFKIDNIEFRLVHTRNYKFSKTIHLLNFCAHNRTVTSTNLNVLIKNINSAFKDDNNNNYVYNGFIISDFLDDTVNRERTDFYIDNIQLSLQKAVTKQDIINKAEPMILTFLKDDINNYRVYKKEIIQQYVSNKYPRYKFLFKNFPEFIDNIMLTQDEDKLELELFKQEQLYKLKLKREGKELEKQLKQKNKDQYIAQKTQYAKKLSEVGKSSLAEYILHRKTVLDILNENLRYSDSENLQYAYEKNIHEIIFPMQKTSDDIDYQSHNLWIIDEKLAYHYYLASDKSLASIPIIESNSKKEPDIIIFDKPFAFTDEDKQPFRNISIIEFKRPGRNDYNDSENPIQQVVEYMDDIIAGKITTKNGREFYNTDNLRFYCYILCDLSDKIKLYAKQRDFKLSPDEMGYYKFMDSYKAYVEIISYDKLVQNSIQRNKILFDKLFNQIP